MKEEGIQDFHHEENRLADTWSLPGMTIWTCKNVGMP
jgi:hypothetical protein